MMNARITRALTERIHLVGGGGGSGNTYTVMGQTGNMYTVVAASGDNIWTCTCPDHTQRHNQCKHIYFIQYRVLSATPHTSPAIPSSPAATATHTPHTVARRDIIEDDTCPICFERFQDTPNDKIHWCRYSCGKNVHRSCYEYWKRANPRKWTCVSCRADWVHIA